MIFEGAGKYGDLRKFVVKINGNDVTDAVLAVNIFQDMFAPTNTAQINFNDTNNLLMNLPIVVGSKVIVEYATDVGSPAGDGEATWEFTVYRIGGKEMRNKKEQRYTIFCAHKAFLLNQTLRVFKSYPNMKCTAAAKKVVEEYLGGSLVSHTDDKAIHFISPGWNPLHVLAWLTRVATKDRAADYVFFQYPDAKFAFKSFEILYTSRAESSGITFTIRPTNLKDEEGNALYDYSTVINQYQWEHFDAMTNLAGGYYQNKLVTYDLITKKWEKKKFVFGDDNAEDKAMLKADDALFMGGEDTSISFLPKHPGMFKTASYLDNSDQWQTSRKSALLKFDQEKLLIQCVGSAKSKDWFAKNCEVDLPAQDWESKEVYDKQRRGRYLVTSIGHIIGKDHYMVNLELVKKRLEST